MDARWLECPLCRTDPGLRGDCPQGRSGREGPAGRPGHGGVFPLSLRPWPALSWPQVLHWSVGEAIVCAAKKSHTVVYFGGAASWL